MSTSGAPSPELSHAPEASGRSFVPSGRELLAMALVAVALRVVLALAAFASFDLCHPQCSQRSAGRTLMHKAHDYALRADGKSYMAYARALVGDVTPTEPPDLYMTDEAGRVAREIIAHDTSKFEDYDKRVFPGFPLLLAPLYRLGIPLPLAALGLSWIACGVAAGLAGLLFADRRVGWAMALLIPHYVLYTSMAMTESVLLAFALAGLVLAMRNRRALLGGLLLGFAGLVRPNAVFAVAGVGAWLVWQRQWRALLMVIVGTGLVFFGGLAAIHWRMGDVFKGVSVYRNHPYAYQGELFTWPFKSLVMTSLKSPRPPLWKVAYIWLHVGMVLAACGLALRGAWRAWRSTPTHVGAMDVLSAPWVIGNTAFIVCVGHIWGFQGFHRFTAWALPAVIWPLRGVLPRKAWAWGIIGGGSLLIALGSVMKN